MKKVFVIIALCFLALATTTCLIVFGPILDEEDSESTELAGTIWRLNSPDDSAYHFDVVYTVSFGTENDISFNRNIGGVNTLMVGTYTYKKGSGNGTVHYSSGDDHSDYKFEFTISEDIMDFTFDLRTITLTKV